MPDIKATGNYIKIKSGLFTTTTTVYNGDGVPIDVEDGTPLRWFQRPFGLVVIAVVSGVIGAGIAKWLGWT